MRFASITIDDAFITFTYAKNISLGKGAVFVPNEHVEATSSFLWALLLVPFEMLQIGSLIGSKFLGVVCSVLSIFLVYKYLAANLEEQSSSMLRANSWFLSLPLLSAVCIVGTGAFVTWTMQGMENPLVSLLIILSLITFSRELDARKGILSFVPVFLLEMVRPEGFAYIFVFVACRILFTVFFNRSTFGNLLSWLGCLSVLSFGYEVWGVIYYGSLLPNTVGAKVPGINMAQILQGMDYVLSVVGIQVLLLGIAGLFSTGLLLVVSIFGTSWSLSLLVPIVVSCLLVGLQLAFCIMTGGDWMPGGRFLSHIAPLAVLNLFLVLVAFYNSTFALKSATRYYCLQAILYLVPV